MTLSLPLSIWALSLSSFLLNFSSVIVFGCTPLIMREYGLNFDKIARMEGIIEGVALIIRAITGWISDLMNRRKIFLLWGYGISSLGRVLFSAVPILCSLPCFAMYGGVLARGGRAIDKIGNGLQASPREAFIGDVSPPDKIGQAYGLNKALSMAGSFMGSAVMLYLFLYAKQSLDEIIFLLKIASAFSVISFLSIKYLVKERKKTPSDTMMGHKAPVLWRDEFKKITSDIQQFKPIFWRTLFVVFIFKLGYFSGVVIMNLLANRPGVSFLGHALFQKELGANTVFLVVQNFTCCLLSYPLGRLSDLLDRRWVVSLGFVFMITSLIIFANASSGIGLYTAIAVYGLQMSIQGALLALLNSTMPHHLHGTGFGLFFLSSGISIILSNMILPVIKQWQSLEIGFLIIAGLISTAFWFLPLLGKADDGNAEINHSTSKKTSLHPEKVTHKHKIFVWTCRALSVLGLSLCLYTGWQHWI